MGLIDLTTLEVTEANVPALELLSRRERRQVELTDHLKIDSSYADILALLVEGRLDGFETSLPDWSEPGDVAGMRAWVRRIDQDPDDPPRAIAVVIDGDVDPSVRVPSTRPANLVVGTTDDEWMIEWITQEVVGLLGYQRDMIVGTALLAIVHPDSAADLVVALNHAQHGQGSAVVQVRLRRPSGVWSVHQMIVSPRPKDTSGIMFLLYPPSPPDAGRNLPVPMNDRLWRMTEDAQVAVLTAHGDIGPFAAELSSRQWEIVTRLRRGERVPQIARAMFLSQSTVRNHLTSVFRKFGVHSQSDLLMKLRSEGEEVQSA